MTATPAEYTTTTQGPALHLALELSESTWVLAFATAAAEPPRRRTIAARNLAALDLEIAKAKCRFRLAVDAPVRSCYEAGRDGFWIARALAARGVHNLVVDPASIEVPRRLRRAKTDRIDAQKLLNQLLRYHAGEAKVFHVCRVPDEADEDRRQLQRELETVNAVRTEHGNRIKGLLATRGLTILGIGASFRTELDRLRDHNKQPVPPDLKARLEREFERWQLADQQSRQIEKERRQRLRTAPEGKGVLDPVRRLLGLRGVGTNGSWLLVMEIFGWRKIRNRRELGAVAGLVPTPYDSGSTTREQGISKAGNRRVRTMMVELAWCWVRYQPDSALTQWFRARFGSGGRRGRKVGIVALARKLLVAFWRYLDQGEVPAGAAVVDWRTKLNRNAATPVGQT